MPTRPYPVTCCCCRKTLTVRTHNKRIAHTAARQEGWLPTKSGWHCPTCRQPLRADNSQP